MENLGAFIKELQEKARKYDEEFQALKESNIIEKYKKKLIFLISKFEINVKDMNDLETALKVFVDINEFTRLLDLPEKVKNMSVEETLKELFNLNNQNEEGTYYFKIKKNKIKIFTPIICPFFYEDIHSHLFRFLEDNIKVKSQLIIFANNNRAYKLTRKRKGIEFEDLLELEYQVV